MVPADIKGMKIRPSQATIAAWVTQLGGTNVQASATRSARRHGKGALLEAVMFPWGSVPLLGVDKVTKNIAWMRFDRDDDLPVAEGQSEGL